MQKKTTKKIALLLAEGGGLGKLFRARFCKKLGSAEE